MEAVSAFLPAGAVRSWITASRPAFHTVGIFPYTLGSMIAYHCTGHFDWSLWGIGTVAVMLVMLSTHLSGECFDHREDMISWSEKPSKFAGGSGVIPRGLITRRAAFWGSVISIGFAVALGLTLWIGYETGPWTIPFGLIGIIGGFFYSSPPFRWVSTGYGEAWIGLCYGFLTVAIGAYLPMGQINLLSTIVSIPIATSIFNVIFANEYPDFESDRIAGKRNLLSRVGRDTGVWVYLVANVIGHISFVVSITVGVPHLALILYSVPFVISVYCMYGFMRGDWKDRDKLERLCGLGIAVNLLTTLSYIVAFGVS